MIPFTTCQKCGELLDATMHDERGTKHPRSDCKVWFRLRSVSRSVVSEYRKSRELDQHNRDLGESGA